MVRSIWMKSAQPGPACKRPYGPIFLLPRPYKCRRSGVSEVSTHRQAQQKSREQFETEIKAKASDDSCPWLRYDEFGTWSSTGGDSEAQVILRTTSGRRSPWTGSARRSHGNPAPRTGHHRPPEALARTMRKDPKTPRRSARALASSRLT